jgi:predicted alpha/beta hydrolase family esterase
MSVSRQILFIQGAGAGAHDEWDDKLVESLRPMLGDGSEIRYPRMPDEDDPSFAKWSAVIRSETADLDASAVVVGHSVARQSSSIHWPSSRQHASLRGSY